MREILRTNDPVRLACARHLLTEAGIAHLVLDEHMAAMEGSISAIQRRLMVSAADEEAARAVLAALDEMDARERLNVDRGAGRTNDHDASGE